VTLVDSHCHLDFDSLQADFAGVLSRAGTAGVETMVTICTKLSEFPRILALTEVGPNIFCSVGVHPHETDREGIDSADVLVEAARHDRVVGIGETGLDYYYMHSDRERQQVSFRAHIEAARETGLPLIVHARDADEDTVAILEDEYRKGPYPGVIHCFTGTKALADKAIELGFYISFSGILTFKSAKPLHEIAKELPADRILVETDAPYLAPVPHRGRTNEPSYVVHTASFLADLRDQSAEAAAAQTTENFYRLFSRATRPR
jgi:TatD DNase family protein